MAYITGINFYNTFILKGNTASEGSSGTVNFHVEESRVKGGFNNNFVDVGVRAHITNEYSGAEERPNALIYSGIFNSKTGVNNINQFSIGENITKAVDSQNGSIQKLFAEDTNLNIFQEEKVSRALIDKDAIYTAEGGALTASGAAVIGQIVAYNGNYGIGTNPESFAYYAGRKYFCDVPKGLVLRLSRDGITEISNYGMRKYFRDNLPTIDNVYGMWDAYNQNYILTLKTTSPSDFSDYIAATTYFQDNYRTLVFSEGVNGWVSHHDIDAYFGGSLNAKSYAFSLSDHKPKHLYSSPSVLPCHVDVIINGGASQNKVFQSLNYEGSKHWSATEITTDSDSALAISGYTDTGMDSDVMFHVSKFKKQDGKYHSLLNNQTTSGPNEIMFGEEISGVKGFFLNLRMKANPSTEKAELFAVSTNFNINTR